MKKRVLSALLGATMAFSLLAGCAMPATTAAPAGADSGADASAETSGASGEIYMFVSSPEYADAISELIEEYKSVAPDVTINYETTQNDYPTLLKAKLNSGEVPDIFSSTSGKEIDTYLEYSYDLSEEPIMTTMDPAVAAAMSSTSLLQQLPSTCLQPTSASSSKLSPRKTSNTSSKKNAKERIHTN